MLIRKILLIEDQADVRENTAEILALSNYKVVQAENGREGVEKALSEGPDLIICDVMMPVLDGYGVLHALQRHPETADIPFIFMTAQVDKQQVRRGMTAGADDYLTKPFEGIELLNAIESCLKKREARGRPSLVDRGRPGTGIAPGAEPQGIPGEAPDLLPAELGSRQVHPFRKKSIVYLEGQRPGHVYYVVSGRIKTYKTDMGGKEFITGIYGPGDFIAYSSVLEEMNFQDNAQALEDAGLVLIPRQEFLQWIGNDPAIAQRFIRLLSRSAAEKEASMVNLAYNSLRKRVANGLLQLMEKYGAKTGEAMTLFISRQNLAHVVGSATESLTRTLSDFKNERLIDIREGNIYILNADKLRTLVN